MPLRDRGPDRRGLLEGEDLERDRVSRRGDGGDDLPVEVALAPGDAGRSNREGLEPSLQKAGRAIVTGSLVHGRLFDGTAGRTVLPACVWRSDVYIFFTWP